MSMKAKGTNHMDMFANETYIFAIILIVIMSVGIFIAHWAGYNEGQQIGHGEGYMHRLREERALSFDDRITTKGKAEALCPICGSDCINYDKYYSDENQTTMKIHCWDCGYQDEVVTHLNG